MTVVLCMGQLASARLRVDRPSLVMPEVDHSKSHYDRPSLMNKVDLSQINHNKQQELE